MVTACNLVTSFTVFSCLVSCKVTHKREEIISIINNIIYRLQESSKNHFTADFVILVNKSLCPKNWILYFWCNWWFQLQMREGGQKTLHPVFLLRPCRWFWSVVWMIVFWLFSGFRMNVWPIYRRQCSSSWPSLSVLSIHVFISIRIKSVGGEITHFKKSRVNFTGIVLFYRFYSCRITLSIRLPVLALDSMFQLCSSTC